MQSKAKMKYHLMPVRIAIYQKSLQKINAEEGMEVKETSYTIAKNVNWHSHHGEQYIGSLQQLKIELPYDPAIPLLGIYPEKL